MRVRVLSALSAMSVLAAGVIGITAGAQAPSPAFAARPTAQSPVGQSCDAVLVDHAGVLSASESNAIEHAAGEFGGTLGFEVRIRILTNDQAPSLDGWVGQEEQACDSWRSVTGGLRANLIVLAIVAGIADEASEGGLYYGDQVPAGLSEDWPAIETDTISPAVTDGQWQQGITEGLQAMRDAIDPPPQRRGYIVAAVTAAVAALIVVSAARRRRQRRRRHGTSVSPTRGSVRL